MTSEDDPEARIRELEQPLAATARESEIGTQQPSKWSPPLGGPFQPPPPLPYNASSSTRPPGRNGNMRWIMLAVFVIAMMCLPLGLFLFGKHQISRSTLPIPSFTVPSPSPSTVTPSASATSTASPTSKSTVPPGEAVTVSGISETRTIACNGGRITVNGITNNVTITGHCSNVTVSGIRNEVILDAADTIQANGSRNHVTYHSGSPEIIKAGLDNVVQKG